MKSLVFAVAVLGLALMMQGCAVYAYPYGRPSVYFGYGPFYGGFAYPSYGYYYRPRPYGYYRYRRW